nr:hypothetical protein [Tanacetum cinerariifolium]
MWFIAILGYLASFRGLPVKPIYPEYIPLEDEHILPAEEQPLPPVVSPTVESPRYVDESDPKEDPEEYEEDETEDVPCGYPMDEGDDGDDDDIDSSGYDADNEDGDEEEEEYEVGESSTSRGEDYGFSDTVEDEMRHREAWAQSIRLSQTVHHELRTLREQVYAQEYQLQTHQAQLQLQSTLIQTQQQLHKTHSQMQQTEIARLRETDRVRQSQIVETLRVIKDMRREMGDMQAELLALRRQPRIAGQPGGDARILNHQDAPRDADSHI